MSFLKDLFKSIPQRDYEKYKAELEKIPMRNYKLVVNKKTGNIEAHLIPNENLPLSVYYISKKERISIHCKIVK